jgi:hypothetical protein
MEELTYRLVRDSLGFYSQVPIDAPVAEVPVAEDDIPPASPVVEEEEDTDLAALGGVQVAQTQEPQEPPRRRRGRPRRAEE